MLTAIHSFSEEDVMAYLDGEVSAERALAVAQHLEQCRGCQRLTADIRELSHKLADWSVEPGAAALPRVKPSENHKQKTAPWRRPWLWIGSAAAIVLVVVLGDVVRPPADMYNRAIQVGSRESKSTSGKFFMLERDMIGGERRATERGLSVMGGPAAPAASPVQPTGPLIVRTAQLTLTSNRFDQLQADVQRIVRMHQGYLAQLDLATPAGAGRMFSATLRVPASHLDTLLQELKGLGRLNSESQRGEDVTEHYVDVNARLSNLRTTEQRLLQILRDRTGKLGDILQVEEAVDRTRGEIETTEAEQKMLSNQLAFAAVQLNVSEEYRVPLAANHDTSTLIRLRNAAVDGVRTAVAGAIGVIAFLLGAGPALILVAAIAFLPVRWLQRKRRDRGALIG